MKRRDFQGAWRGSYSYAPETGLPTTAFELVWTPGWFGGLRGHSDEKHAFGKASIVGRYKDGLLRFIMTYRTPWGIDAAGKPQELGAVLASAGWDLVQPLSPHVVLHEGKLADDAAHFAGRWVVPDREIVDRWHGVQTIPSQTGTCMLAKLH